MRQPMPMRRLLQGDVGSGKTIVALEAAIIAIENGHQAALMAPTEILATQHYLSARRILEPCGYRVVLLTGSLDQQQKRDVRRHIAQGNAQLVIGTHALIEEKVEFGNLGLVIVDEQHRFGVMQRMKLMKKALADDEEAPEKSSFVSLQATEKTTSCPKPEARSPEPDLQPDVLVMTATPIPRTLALTLYGDLDVSVLDEMPPGRTPVETKVIDSEMARARAYEDIRKEVESGRQAFIVCPLVEASENLEAKAAES